MTTHHSDFIPTREDILVLYAETNMPLMKCKQALIVGNGNKRLAKEWLRWNGLAICRHSPLSNEELAEQARQNGFNPKYADRNDLVWMAKYG